MLVQRTVSFCLSLAIVFLSSDSQPALGQHLAQSQSAPQPLPRSAIVARVNDSTITIVGGDIHSSSARMTQDLALLLNVGKKRRVLSVLGRGSVSSVSDVLHLKGADIGIVHEDSLSAIRQHEVFPKVSNRLQYIAKLGWDNVYVIARKSITNIRDLTGKKVNFGPGSDSLYSTPALLFKALSIEVKNVNLHHKHAIDQIKSGELAATVIVGGDLADLTARFGTNKDWHPIPIPLLPKSTSYVPVKLKSQDYPNILPAKKSLQTVAVALVMIVNNWPVSHKRHQKVAQFVEAFFGRFKELTKPSYQPKWKQVNLAARLPNWMQFAPAKKWLQSEPSSDSLVFKELEARFNSFLSANNAGKGRKLDEGERKRLFASFLKWPENPGKVQVTVRLAANNGVGKKIGIISAQNTEILVAGRKKPALLLKPKINGLRPGRHAFHIQENPNCGPGKKEGKSGPALVAGRPFLLSGTEALDRKTFGANLANLPDLEVDADRVARKQVIAPRLTLSDIVNSAIMIRASQNDASPPVACGVVR